MILKLRPHTAYLKFLEKPRKVKTLAKGRHDGLTTVTRRTLDGRTLSRVVYNSHGKPIRHYLSEDL